MLYAFSTAGDRLFCSSLLLQVALNRETRLKESNKVHQSLNVLANIMTTAEPPSLLQYSMPGIYLWTYLEKLHLCTPHR